MRGWKHFIGRSAKSLHQKKNGVTHVDSKNEQQSGEQQSTPIDIGPYAGEERMPSWLIRVLKNSDKTVLKEVIDSSGRKRTVKLKVVETPNLIPTLAILSRADPDVNRASLCSPNIHHVAKLRREGSFCGYRNIQMMMSYLCNTKTSGYEQFSTNPLPSIFTLQEMVEEAWKRGFNSSSREELGSIHMTRKFIGTSEVEALLLSLNVPVVRRAFVPDSTSTAYQNLVKFVSDYFMFNTGSKLDDKVIVTQKPPIFLQRQGHSMTIVGIEETSRGVLNLLVFDPKYEPSKAVKKSTSSSSNVSDACKLMRAYRYGISELGKYGAFEVVQLQEKSLP